MLQLTSCNRVLTILLILLNLYLFDDQKVKDMSAKVVDSNPYSRLMALQIIGVVENYERIREFSVAIVGIGGVGSVAVEMLTRCGIVRLLLYDYDKVELANMNRLFFCLEQVGMTKTDAAVQILTDVNPDVVLEVVASGVDERTLKREGVCAASLPTTMGYSSLKDFFPTMAMKPNPLCSNAACLERQTIALRKEYILAKPARDAAAKAKMEAEALATAADVPLHVDNEWNICVVVDDNELESTCGTSSDALPEGLTRELPSANEFQKPPPSGATDAAIDDLEDLRRQLDAPNAD